MNKNCDSAFLRGNVQGWSWSQNKQKKVETEPKIKLFRLCNTDLKRRKKLTDVSFLFKKLESNISQP